MIIIQSIRPDSLPLLPISLTEPSAEAHLSIPNRQASWLKIITCMHLLKSFTDSMVSAYRFPFHSDRIAQASHLISYYPNEHIDVTIYWLAQLGTDLIFILLYCAVSTA